MKDIPRTFARPRAASRPPVFIALATLILISALAIPMAFAQGQKQTRITFWHAMGRGRQALLQELFKEFSKENPDVVVEDKLFPGYNELNGGILSAVAQRQSPDVAQVYENWTTQLIDVNAIAAVDDYAKGPDGFSRESMSDILPVFLKANIYKGKLWTLPFNKSLYVLYCNMDALKKAGVQPPRTWDEFAVAARKLTVVEGDKKRIGFAYRTNVDMFSLLVAAFGGDLLDAGHTSPLFQTPPGRKAASFLVDLVQKDKAAMNSFDDANDFLDARSAMYIETTTKMAWFAERAKFQVGMFPVPAGTKKPYLFAGTNIAMFRTDSTRQNASWRLMKFLLRKESQVRWALATGYIPVRKSAIESPEYQAFLKRDPRNAVPLSMLPESVAQNPPAPAWQIIRGMLDDRLFMAVAGKMPVQEALDGVALAAGRLMKVGGTP